MDEAALEQLLQQVKAGEVSPDDAVAELRKLPFADLGFAKVDHHRVIRQGAAEAIYAPGKTPDQCVGIVAELLATKATPVIVSRVGEDQRQALAGAHAGSNQVGDTMVWNPAPRSGPSRIAVVTAGTADHVVADEAQTVLEAHGENVERINDCGVAGLHRLLAAADRLAQAEIVIVVAGMEGALASVVGGLVKAPVIAVPTSVGYGSSLEGVTALLGMHASCASGITVVGIDNGFGAALAAMRILRMPAASDKLEP